MTHQAHDVLFILLPVRVGADAAAFVLLDLILIDDPLQGDAVAETVLECFRWDAGQSQRRVDAQGRLVLGQLHLVLDLSTFFLIFTSA